MGLAGIQPLPLKIIFYTGALWWGRGEVQPSALKLCFVSRKGLLIVGAAWKASKQSTEPSPQYR